MYAMTQQDSSLGDFVKCDVEVIDAGSVEEAPLGVCK
jgi:hypothetical protein